MKEVLFKNKDAAHVIVVNGKQIRFKNGVAQVTDSEAEFIKSRADPDYKVIEPEPQSEQPEKKPQEKTKAKPKPKRSTRRKRPAKKSKE